MGYGWPRGGDGETGYFNIYYRISNRMPRLAAWVGGIESHGLVRHRNIFLHSI